MKLVRIVLTFDSCHRCPYHSGGSTLGSALYCTYFTPLKMIFDSNGNNCKFEPNRMIATFCPIKDDEIHNYLK